MLVSTQASTLLSKYLHGWDLIWESLQGRREQVDELSLLVFPCCVHTPGYVGFNCSCFQSQISTSAAKKYAMCNQLVVRTCFVAAQLQSYLNGYRANNRQQILPPRTDIPKSPLEPRHRAHSNPQTHRRQQASVSNRNPKSNTPRLANPPIPRIARINVIVTRKENNRSI